VPAVLAPELPLADEGHRSPSDAQGASEDEGLGHFAARGLDDARKRGTRDSHPRGSVVLVEALEVGEAEGLQLVDAQGHFFEA
jgi:hypothetical protein